MEVVNILPVLLWLLVEVTYAADTNIAVLKPADITNRLLKQDIKIEQRNTKFAEFEKLIVDQNKLIAVQNTKICRIENQLGIKSSSGTGGSGTSSGSESSGSSSGTGGSDATKQSSNPCKNVNCGDKGTCSNGKCKCQSGFTGEKCQNKIDLCGCGNRGTCVNGKCKCNFGFAGEKCQNLPSTCSGVRSKNGVCVNVWNSKDESKTYPVAKTSCEKAGGSLIVPSIVGAKTIKELLDLLEASKIYNSKFAYWLGAEDVNGWKWLTGEAISLKDSGWGTGEPNSEHEKCGSIKMYDGSMRMNDAMCNSVLKFICGKK